MFILYIDLYCAHLSTDNTKTWQRIFTTQAMFQVRIYYTVYLQYVLTIVMYCIIYYKYGLILLYEKIGLKIKVRVVQKDPMI